MNKINLPFFYQLGTHLGALAALNTEGIGKTEVILKSWRAKEHVVALLRAFPSLTVCRATGQELLDAMEGVDEWFRKASAEDMQKELDPRDFKLRQAITKAKEFETVLSAELQTLATYEASQKGIYSTPDLIERAEQVLPESVVPKINPRAIEEIRLAGRALAFDTATACGFHIMRATEVVLHDYYVAACNPKPKPKERLKNWGAYIGELNNVASKPAGADVKEVVAIIQQVKDQHRNLIMHPDVVLTPDEAFTLFEVAQSAIIAMAGRLKVPRKKKTSKPPSARTP
jgi:hypothetical protein